MKTILYLTTNGLAEPLGRSQILPYLIGLSKNYKIIILSDEKKIDLKNNKLINRIENLVEQNNIIWDYEEFKYSKFSKPFSLFLKFIKGSFYCFKYNVELIHCRSYLPNLVGLTIKFFLKKPLIFDMRGLWPEEIALGIPSGRKSIIYKSLRFLERLNIKKSDHIVSLTNAAIDKYLIDQYQLNIHKITTIPTCVDMDRFIFSPLKESSIKKFSCIGTILSDWFLTDWLTSFFKCVEEFDSNALFEIITRDCKQTLISRMDLNDKLRNKITIRSATPDQMPELLISHTASAMFFNSDISKLGSSPTRFGEILAVGRPIICNSGVGDLDQIIEDNRVGVIVKNPEYEFMKNSVSKIYKIIDDPLISSRCRQLAESYYSLSKGVKTYSEIYEKLKDAKK